MYVAYGCADSAGYAFRTVCVAHHFYGGVLFTDRSVVTSVLSCLVGCQCESRPPLRPVLKHGPRSVTCTRVKGWETLRRNESKGRLTD